MTAVARTPSTGLAPFDSRVAVRPFSTLLSDGEWLRGMLLVRAAEAEAPEEGH